MPLIDPASSLPSAQLASVWSSLIDELKELPEILADAPGAPEPNRARSGTARQLVADVLRWAGNRSPPEDRPRLIAEVNLLYDVSIVAAEYYKLFVRPPTPERPAGRI